MGISGQPRQSDANKHRDGMSFNIRRDPSTHGTAFSEVVEDDQVLVPVMITNPPPETLVDKLDFIIVIPCCTREYHMPEAAAEEKRAPSGGGVRRRVISRQRVESNPDDFL